MTGASLAVAVFALAGCNEKAAEAPVPGRPVLVANVHYAAETPERSFVGTIRPRIESDMIQLQNFSRLLLVFLGEHETKTEFAGAGQAK